MRQININLTKVLSACLLLLFAVQCCAATTVSIADITADPGDVVTVPIMINEMTDYGTGTINITYDPPVVHVTGVTSSSNSTVAAFNNNNVAGFTAISASNFGGASGDIVFANVEFTAVGAGSSPLNIGVISLYNRSSLDNPISVTVDGGLFTSGDISTPPTPTPTTHSRSSSGRSSTGAVSITTPTPAPPPTPTPTPTPTPAPSVEDGANPASTSESTSPTDEETDTSGATSPTVKPTPNSKKSPGFEAIFAVIGLVILSLIIRRDNT